jgi:hypothetical protein
MHHQTATQDGASHVETVERTDVATGLADGRAEASEGARDVVQLAIEGDGEGGGRFRSHRVVNDTTLPAGFFVFRGQTPPSNPSPVAIIDP